MDSEIKSRKTAIETYSDDIAEVLENDHEGLVKKIISEEEAREIEKKNLSPESRKNKLFIQGSISLFIFALGVWGFIALSRGPGTVEIAPEAVPLVFAEKSSFIETAGLKRNDVIHSIFNTARDSAVKEGGIEGIYLTQDKKIVGLRQFIGMLGASFAPDKNPLIVSDAFMLGRAKSRAEGEPEGAGIFMLLKTRASADIFDSLRAWEQKMFYDLRELLGRPGGAEENYLLTKKFEDTLIENKNARQLLDKDNNLVLLYVFADNNAVIITDSKNAAKEIMLRLISKETKE